MSSKLYLNYTKKALGIPDHEMLDRIKEMYDQMDKSDESITFSFSNCMILYAVELLCVRGKIAADDIVYMNEGKEVDMKYIKFGKSHMFVPSTFEGNIPNIFEEWIEELAPYTEN